MRKKILASLCAALLLTGLLSGTALADENHATVSPTLTGDSNGGSADESADLKAAAEKAAALKAEIKALEQQVKQQAQANATAFKQSNAGAAELLQKAKMLRQQLEDATKQKIKPLADQVKSLQEQLKQLRQQLKGMRATGGSKGDKGSKERHEPGRDDLQQQIHQIEQQIHEVQQQIRAQLDAQKGTRTELAQVLAKLRELRKGSEALQKQLRPLQQAEMELRAKLAGLNRARKEAWQQVEAAQKAHDHDAELAALNRASGLEQEVRGIYQQILEIKRKVGAVVQAAR